MPQITISWNPDELYRDLTALAEDQVPFALSQTINNAAKVFQRAEQGVLTRNFVLRHQTFILRGVYIPRFCTKRDTPMQVTILIEPHRDFLYKFEAGGTKVSRVGGTVAVPLAARANLWDVVPNQLRPKALGFTQTAAGQWKGALRTFIITLPSGQRGIMQRVGPGKGGVRLLFSLKPSVPIPNSLHFGETASGTIIDALEQDFPYYFREAMRTRRIA